MQEESYLLKIQLLGIKPPIWRRFVVPASITLDRLHDVIQIVMGWLDCHPHLFIIKGTRYTENPETDYDGENSGLFHLNELVKRVGTKFRYIYDFGDEWMHELVLEERMTLNPEYSSDLLCLEGARACPPEDVGGVFAYFEFCEALEDENHENHERYMEWTNGDFDSEEFSAEFLNLMLRHYRRWSRDRELDWNEFD